MTRLRIKLAFTVKCLCENRLRFFLTVLSIAVAVCSVLMISAFGSYGEKAVWEELDSLHVGALDSLRDVWLLLPPIKFDLPF